MATPSARETFKIARKLFDIVYFFQKNNTENVPDKDFNPELSKQAEALEKMLENALEDGKWYHLLSIYAGYGSHPIKFAKFGHGLYKNSKKPRTPPATQNTTNNS